MICRESGFPGPIPIFQLGSEPVVWVVVGKSMQSTERWFSAKEITKETGDSHWYHTHTYSETSLIRPCNKCTCMIVLACMFACICVCLHVQWNLY